MPHDSFAHPCCKGFLADRITTIKYKMLHDSLTRRLLQQCSYTLALDPQRRSTLGWNIITLFMYCTNCKNEIHVRIKRLNCNRIGCQHFVLVNIQRAFTQFRKKKRKNQTNKQTNKKPIKSLWRNSSSFNLYYSHAVTLNCLSLIWRRNLFRKCASCFVLSH